ncbi:MAG: DNA-processing protein DprA [Acidimicrobiales bacterium]
MRAAPLTEDERSALGLASLGAGPRRIRRFLDGFSPTAAWEALAEGVHPADLDHAYRDKATPALIDSAAVSCERAGGSVLVLGLEGYPEALAEDPDAPAILFAWGEPSTSDCLARVAVVGTRSATPYGLGVASELGRGLADTGVTVVSGLAKGVDSAAHAGSLGSEHGAPLAVLGTALDGRLAPAQHALRRQVAERGAVVSEIPPGSEGAPAWWFAIRNRVMAALAHVVVVVECHLNGGALHTVRYALQRGVPVAAVPGSVRSVASSGTNSLLVDGASPVRDTDDVLSILELAIAGKPGVTLSPTRSSRAQGAPPRRRGALELSSTQSQALAALDHDPAPLDAIVLRSGLSIGEAALALEQLSGLGIAESEAGWWSRPRR